MLPCRLRPPVYGSKLKQQKKESSVDQLSGGGPVQRAMEKDLLELRPAFLQQLSREASKAADGPHADHDPPGRAFAIFRKVFGEGKMPIVFTRMLPPRSDRDGFSQLIYAACLSLLKAAFPPDDTGCSFSHASYALFCLFALYETNPLPVLVENPMHLIPLGIQNAENPKTLFRRNYRSRIRVDRQHFAMMHRARDEALGRQADCQLCRMRAWEALVEDRHALEKPWCCQCGIATDTVFVVDRLFARMDRCEYTGPQGLEALAGHADYPYGSVRPPKKRKIAKQNAAKQLPLISEQELHQIAARTDEVSVTEELKTRVDHYRSKLQSIRFSQADERKLPNQMKRIRNNVEPTLEHSTKDFWDEIDKQIGNRSEPGDLAQATESANVVRTLGFAPATAGTKETVPNGTDERQTSESVPTKGGPLMPYQLMLPRDTRVAVQDGIQASLNELLERGELHIPTETAEPTRSTWQRDAFSVVQDEASVRSIVTGQGQAALRSLLSAVAAKNNRRPGYLPVTVVPAGKKQNSVGATMSEGDRFLDMDADLLNEDSELSSVSSSEDEMSVVASTVGQSALRSLLASVQDDTGEQHASSTKQNRSTFCRRRRAPVEKERPESPPPRTGLTRRDNSTGSPTSSGREALAALLARVASPVVTDDTKGQVID